MTTLMEKYKKLCGRIQQHKNESFSIKHTFVSKKSDTIFGIAVFAPSHTRAIKRQRMGRREREEESVKKKHERKQYEPLYKRF